MRSSTERQIPAEGTLHNPLPSEGEELSRFGCRIWMGNRATIESSTTQQPFLSLRSATRFFASSFPSFSLSHMRPSISHFETKTEELGSIHPHPFFPTPALCSPPSLLRLNKDTIKTLFSRMGAKKGPPPPPPLSIFTFNPSSSSPTDRPLITE